MDKANIIAQVIFLSCKEEFPLGYAKSPADIKEVKEFKGLSNLREVQWEDIDKYTYKTYNPFTSQTYEYKETTPKRYSGEVKLAIDKVTKIKVYYSYLMAFDEAYAVPKVFLYEIVED